MFTLGPSHYEGGKGDFTGTNNFSRFECVFHGYHDFVGAIIHELVEVLAYHHDISHFYSIEAIAPMSKLEGNDSMLTVFAALLLYLIILMKQ